MKFGIILMLFCSKIIQCLCVVEYRKIYANLTMFPSDILSTTERIDLRYNSISNIPEDTLVNMTNLIYLNLALNSLTAFPYLCDVGHTLREAILYTNRIEMVPVDLIRCLKVLARLHMGGNRFTEIPDLSVLGPTLKYFHLNHNHRLENITTDIISKLTELILLDFASSNFDENQLLALGLNSSHIKTLSIYGNNIKTFPDKIIEKLDHLETISLGSNPYEMIPQLSRVKSTLKVLNFDGYKMINVPDQYLKGMDRLVKISLKWCELKRWPLTLNDVSGTIEVIELSQNEITDIPVHVGMSKLKTLDLSFNGLTAIQENVFQGAPQLTHLKLMGNMLQTLYDLGTNLLQTLYLDDNPFVCDCRVAWLKNLVEEQHVDISDTGNPLKCTNPVELKDFDFQYVTKEMMCADSGRWYRNPNVMGSGNATTVDQPALTIDDCALLCLSCTDCKAFDMKGQNLQCRLFIGNLNKCEKEQFEYFIKYL